MLPQERKKRKRTTEEDFEAVILKHSFGASNKQIAEQLDLDRDTVTRCVNAYEIAKAQDWGAALKYVNAGYRLKYLEWSADRMGLQVPDHIVAAYDTWCVMHNTKKAKEEPKPEEKQEETIKEEAKADKRNEDLYLCKVLEALAKTNELLEQFMDVVIPKYAIDLKDNVNVNSDLLCQRLQSCEDKLEKVAYNTRKRGA